MLMRHLQAHADQRGAAASGGPLLRYRSGEPITRRRYDPLWHRLGQHLPWVATQQISTHWLRHTTLTWVERHCGYAVARAYAGHTHTTGGVTAAPPAPTSAPPSPKSPQPSTPSPEKTTHWPHSSCPLAGRTVPSRAGFASAPSLAKLTLESSSLKIAMLTVSAQVPGSFDEAIGGSV
ncbi:hypothetical protein FHX42_001180 [Saccharopolyspora lacisalsi]|uniref:Phage integrase family protein n=1 Tax=Halosaccharopolyspora lacisalsi TaxID=1000566 RepID=A0A839DXA9_9PSEU|nr:hypothetical protein [Halosaccharopolyspora lacisalsi]MBA8823851.1 hypothetical protein [Halosaccharopolyspora lacisalsi]